MSEAPPDKPTEAASETKAEAAPKEAPKDASPSASPDAAPPAGSALGDAAKAMDTAEKKAEESAKAAPVDPVKDAPAQGVTAAQTALAPSAAANTSGMHLQYVAPGVRRQSWFETNKYPIALISIFSVMFLFMFRGGGMGGDLAGGLPGGAQNGGPAPTPTLLGPLAQQQPPTTDDTSYEPLQNRMPASDLTVNAGAINGKPPLLATHGDAGANKGGYADERADLDVAEAMIAKDPDKALALADKHDRDYPRGILDPDVRIIRIEAFQKKGDDAKALALSDEFLQDYPHSPRAGRVQAIAEQIKNKGGGGNNPP